MVKYMHSRAQKKDIQNFEYNVRNSKIMISRVYGMQQQEK